MNLDPSFLRAALLGYQNELARIDKAMADVRRQLSQLGQGESAPSQGQDRRGMSAAARRRIAAAQKKRWAAYRKTKRSKK